MPICAIDLISYKQLIKYVELFPIIFTYHCARTIFLQKQKKKAFSYDLVNVRRMQAFWYFYMSIVVLDVDYLLIYLLVEIKYDTKGGRILYTSPKSFGPLRWNCRKSWKTHVERHDTAVMRFADANFKARMKKEELNWIPTIKDRPKFRLATEVHFSGHSRILFGYRLHTLD